MNDEDRAANFPALVDFRPRACFRSMPADHELYTYVFAVSGVVAPSVPANLAISDAFVARAERRHDDYA